MGSADTPLVTFVVPCYNSAAYMARAVDSLLLANHPCEILLVNDGSTDDTSEIAHAYAARHPQVRAIDQPNANWGGAVNHGLELARGSYFKVVDSDDCLDEAELHRTLDELARLVGEGTGPDLLITNYVYDHLPTGTRRTMSYRTVFPQGRVFGWGEIRRPPIDTYLMIHACWYATATLRASGVLLPTGMPYMDSLLLLHPLPLVERVAYLDAAPYLYAIGREGQSIDVDVVKRHIDEQIYVTKLAIADADYAELFAREPNLATLIAGYLQCMMSVSTLNLFTIGTPDAVAKNDELWEYLRRRSPVMYRKVRRSWVGLANRRTALGRRLAVRCYALGKKVYKLA